MHRILAYIPLVLTNEVCTHSGEILHQILCKSILVGSYPLFFCTSIKTHKGKIYTNRSFGIKPSLHEHMQSQRFLCHYLPYTSCGYTARPLTL